MKKCKWCNSNIEDNVSICPYCKANQNVSTDNSQTNHVEKFLEKHPNGRTTPIWQREKQNTIIKCPTCGSTKAKKITLSNRSVSILVLGICSNKINKTFECKSCGYTW